MGNEQSTQAGTSEGRSQKASGDTDEEPFDLDEIEDSRQFLRPKDDRPKPWIGLDGSIERVEEKKSRKKKKKEHRRKSDQDTSLSPQPDEGSAQETLEERQRRLEPEQYGVYESSDDDKDDDVRVSGILRNLPTDSQTSTSEHDDSEVSELEEEVRPELKSDLREDAADDLGQFNDQDDSAAPRTAASNVNEVPRLTSDRHLCPHAKNFNCDKTFSKLSSAQRHGLTHTSPFICPICQKSLSRQDSLNQHIQKHSRADRDQSNVDAADMMEVDTSVQGNKSSEQPDPVDKPEQPGSSSDEMSQDQARPVPCPLANLYNCDKRYIAKQAAERHAESHTKDLSCPLGCTQAGTDQVLGFGSTRSLQRHLKNLHKSGKEQKKAQAILSERARIEGASFAKQKDQHVDDTGDDGEETGSLADGVPQYDGAQSQTEPKQDGDEPIFNADDEHLTNEADRPLAAEDTNPAEPQVDGSKEELDVALEDKADQLVDATEHDSGPTRKQLHRDEPDESTIDQQQTTRKRKRGHISTPLTSPQSHRSEKRSRKDPGQDLSTFDLPIDASTNTNQFQGVYIGTPKKPSKGLQRRQSSLKTFVQPYTAGSSLRHPIFHPESPENTKHARAERPEAELRVRLAGFTPWRKNQKTSSAQRLTTKKGKERAVSDDEGDDSDAIVKPATDPVRRVRPLTATPKPGPKKDAAPSGADGVFELEQDDVAGTKANGENNEKPLTAERKFVCRACKRKFKNGIRLKIHQNNPRSHTNLLECEDCGEQYYHNGNLIEHKRATGHGLLSAPPTGRRFTTEEHKIMKHWAKQFCEEYDLADLALRELVEDSYRVGREWRFEEMSKQDFLDEFYDLLPNRDREAMKRYRAKHFNSANNSTTWSTEEDKEILRLHETMGNKWSKIAEKMNRPPELVRQRYKNKLQTTNRDFGAWTKPEEALFKQAVDKVRRASNSASAVLQNSAADSFNWTAVSKLMQTRTPQQCSGHWRAKYGGLKKGDVWVKDNDFETPSKIPVEQSIRSKMEQRLDGDLSTSAKKRKIMSEEYVHESDDDGAANDEDDDDEDIMRPPESDEEMADVDDEEQQDVMPAPEENDEAEVARNSRNLLPIVTPGRLTQVFNQTQANTSAKRFGGFRSASQERPSPAIELQHRRDRSPDLGTPSDDLSKIEESDAGSASDNDYDKENKSQDKGHTDSEDEPEHEENDNASKADLRVPAGRSKDHYDQTANSRADEATSDAGSDDETESETESAPANGLSKQQSASASNKTTTTNTATTSDDENPSDSDSSSLSKSRSSSTSGLASDSDPKPSSKPTATPSKLAEVANDFMSSINKHAAKRRAAAQTQARKPRSRQSIRFPDSSDEDYDPKRQSGSQKLPANPPSSGRRRR